ncbi:amino acid ABC transporter permease [Halorubrum sp. DTA98]|uniref:amino acid ABC transporter permease n=1 Tax=Halorubrum sp. DTA98 TaxID=3402163 RepID=UPI003AAAFB57
MASATRPATVRERAAAADLSVGRLLLIAVGALFWAWLVASWVNRWLGGVIVPVGEPFVSPAAVEAALATTPGLSAYANDVAFAVDISPEIARGMWLTIVITAVSLAVGFFIAVPLSVARVYGRYSAYASLAYTELLRGTPLLAQLFVLHYGLNLSQYVPGVLSGVFPRNVVWVAIVGFTLNGAAYQAEYIRGALESVEEGQITAGRAIGLSKVETIYYVVLPQGLRYAIPSWTNEFVYLIKYSSLAAFITVPELYYRAFQIASNTFRYTVIFAVTGLAYLALVLTASKLMARVEDAVAIPGLGADRDR